MKSYSEVINNLVKSTIDEDFFREVKLGNQKINMQAYINRVSTQLIKEGFYKVDNVSFLGVDKNTEEYLRFTLEQIFIQMELKLEYVEYDKSNWCINIIDKIQFSKYLLDLNINELHYIIDLEELFIKNLQIVIRQSAESLLTIFIQEEIKPRLRYAMINSQVQLEVGYSEDVILIEMVGNQLFNSVCHEVNTELPSVKLTSNIDETNQVIVFNLEYK